MKARASKIAALLLVVFIGVVGYAFRSASLNRFGKVTGIVSLGDVCLEIVENGIYVGMICERASSLMSRSIEDLGVDESCAKVVLPRDVMNCTRIRLVVSGSKCSVSGTEPISGVLRWLCGEGMDINNTDEKDLKELPGIGEKRASSIVEDRVRNGSFSTPEDLTRVNGIGEHTVSGIEP